MREGYYGVNKLIVNTIYSGYRLVGKKYILKTRSWWTNQRNCTVDAIFRRPFWGRARNRNCIFCSSVGNATLRSGATLVNRTFTVHLRLCRIVRYDGVQLENGFWLKYIFVRSSNIEKSTADEYVSWHRVSKLPPI